MGKIYPPSMTGHQQPFPSSTKDGQKYRQSSETESTSNLCAHVCAHHSVWQYQQFHTPSGFPQCHVAMRVTLHSGRNTQLRSTPGTAPPPPKNLAQSPPKIPWPPGHRTTQNNRTHQHFHLHPQASSGTAAAAVRPLTGTDRLLKSTKVLQLAHPLSPPVIRAQTEPDLDESARQGVVDSCPLAVLLLHRNIRPNEKTL